MSPEFRRATQLTRDRRFALIPRQVEWEKDTLKTPHCRTQDRRIRTGAMDLLNCTLIVLCYEERNDRGGVPLREGYSICSGRAL